MFDITTICAPHSSNMSKYSSLNFHYNATRSRDRERLERQLAKLPPRPSAPGEEGATTTTAGRARARPPRFAPLDVVARPKRADPLGPPPLDACGNKVPYKPRFRDAPLLPLPQEQVSPPQETALLFETLLDRDENSYGHVLEDEDILDGVDRGPVVPHPPPENDAAGEEVRAILARFGLERYASILIEQHGFDDVEVLSEIRTLPMALDLGLPESAAELLLECCRNLRCCVGGAAVCRDLEGVPALISEEEVGLEGEPPMEGPGEGGLDVLLDDPSPGAPRPGVGGLSISRPGSAVVRLPASWSALKGVRCEIATDPMDGPGSGLAGLAADEADVVSKEGGKPRDHLEDISSKDEVVPNARLCCYVCYRQFMVGDRRFSFPLRRRTFPYLFPKLLPAWTFRAAPIRRKAILFRTVSPAAGNKFRGGRSKDP